MQLIDVRTHLDCVKIAAIQGKGDIDVLRSFTYLNRHHQSSLLK